MLSSANYTAYQNNNGNWLNVLDLSASAPTPTQISCVYQIGRPTQQIAQTGILDITVQTSPYAPNSNAGLAYHDTCEYYSNTYAYTLGCNTIKLVSQFQRSNRDPAVVNGTNDPHYVTLTFQLGN